MSAKNTVMNIRNTQSVPLVDSAGQLNFQPIRSTRAFEEIAAQIRTELAEGRLKVGSRLPSERALSERFGVSRNTLREALRSLEHAGLVRLQRERPAVRSSPKSAETRSLPACWTCSIWGHTAGEVDRSPDLAGVDHRAGSLLASQAGRLAAVA